MKRTAILALAIALGACGRLAELQPAEGHSLPVKPLMATVTPTAEELLTPPAYARPERVDEIIKRSEPRRSDRFDLPPPDGGAVPLPIGADDEQTSSDEVGPATPQ